MPLYVVETIQTFRLKYVVECRAAEHAADTVVMNEVDEFSQMFLGEQIINSKEISRKDFKRMNSALENYGDGSPHQPESGSPWMGEQMIHVVEYGADE